jgi:hypothetical protein
MIQEILSQEFELLKKDLILLYEKKGMRSSGKWADSLTVTVRSEIGKYTAVLTGLDYSVQLEVGRKAGKFPPLEDIRKWIIEKGVFAEALRSITISSLAFLIARKIANQGWKRERFGGVNLISEVVTDERLQKIIDEVGTTEAVRASNEILKLINELQEA